MVRCWEPREMTSSSFSAFSLPQQKAPLTEWSTLAAIAAYPLQCWHFLDRMPNECWGVCMCVVYIMQRQARDCWLAIAEDRASNTANEGLLSDQFASCFQLSRDYSKFPMLCLWYMFLFSCSRKAESVDIALCCCGRLLDDVCCLISWIIGSAWWFGERGEGCGDGFSVTSTGDSRMGGDGFWTTVLKVVCWS